MEENKTYLLNIKSNLKDYIDQLIKAKERLADAKKAVDDLKTGQFKSREEIELTNKAYREAKTEVSNATKLVDLATKANKAQSGSYEQLLRQYQLMQTALKLEGGMMLQNTDGTYKLTEKYIQLSKKVDEAKKGIDAFGKGIHDNRLNVGNYGETVRGAMEPFSMMPGVVGRAASSIQMFAMSFEKILSVSAITAGITAALAALSAPFIAFFKYSQEGMDLLAQKTSRVKAEINVLKGELISIGKSAIDAGKDSENALDKIWSFVKTFTGIGLMINLTGKELKLIFPELVKNMKAAGDAAEELKKKEQELDASEIALIKSRAETNLQLKQARLDFADTNKSIDQRIDALELAFKLENQMADKEVEHQKEVVQHIKETNDLKLKAGILTREDDRKLAEAEAKVDDLRTESLGRQLRGIKQLATAKKDLMKEADAEIMRSYKAFTDYWDRIDKEADKKINDDFKRWSDYWDRQDKLEEEHKKRDIEAGFAYQDLKNKYDADALQANLNNQYAYYLTSDEHASAFINERLLADQKYTEATNALSEMRIQQKLNEVSVFSDLTGSMAELLGKQSEAGKAFAVSQAIMDTYAGATLVLTDKTIPSTYLRLAMMASVIIKGLNNVHQILSVNTKGQNTSLGSVPTSITSSPPLQHILAPSSGATIFTQPSMTQKQLNESIGSLTADDIAKAVAQLPAPIVTVEDINVRSNQVKKVSVRANI